MEKKLQEQVEKRLKEGWIKASMFIEVMAIREDVARTALKKHIDSLEKEDKCLVYKKDYGEIKKIENPRPNIPEAYSYIVEVEVLVQNLDKLVFIVMSYGPTSIEILEPKELRVKMGEAQGILNSISNVIHQFAAMGVGGIVVKSQ